MFYGAIITTNSKKNWGFNTFFYLDVENMKSSKFGTLGSKPNKAESFKVPNLELHKAESFKMTN